MLLSGNAIPGQTLAHQSGESFLFGYLFWRSLQLGLGHIS